MHKKCNVKCQWEAGMKTDGLAYNETTLDLIYVYVTPDLCPPF